MEVLIGIMKMTEIRDKKILVDTNIPIFYANEGFKERSGNILRILKDSGNILAVSEITSYELFNTDSKDQRLKYYINFLNYIERKEVSATILNNANLLNNEYRKFGCKHTVPLPDLIIGGTVINSQNSLLLTADRNDFCEPLWQTVAHYPVAKENGEIEANLYLLQFNKQISNHAGK